MTNGSALELDIQGTLMTKAALTIRAVNHKLRQQILQLIHANGRMTVKEIYVKLRLEQSVASQHLAILRKARCVCTERSGKYIFYSVNYHQIRHIHQIADVLLTQRPEEA